MSRRPSSGHRGPLGIDPRRQITVIATRYHETGVSDTSFPASQRDKKLALRTRHQRTSPHRGHAC
jgi:hypothetical protein